MHDFLTLGLLGHPLTHSLSPHLHTAALQYAGLKGQYLLFDVPPAHLSGGFTKMLQQGVAGFNVTIPYKQKMWEKVHELTPEARQTGAVNTVKVIDEGNLAGHNTDVGGFEFALAELMCAHGIDKLYGKTALVIGAGGAARAAITALSRLGLATIKIRGRDLTKVDSKTVIGTDTVASTGLHTPLHIMIAELAERIMQAAPAQTKACGDQLIFFDTPEPHTSTLSRLNAYTQVQGPATACPIHLKPDDGNNYEQLSIVVNASPIGLLDDTCPEWLPMLVGRLSHSNKCICFDMVYHKDKTSPIFTRLAQQRELPVVDGLPMLVHQARLAFEYWTGASVPYEIMYAAL